MSRGKLLFTWDFVPEWCAIAILAMIDAVWAARLPLNFTAGWTYFLLPGAGLALTLAARLFAFRRGGLMAEYFALTLVASTAICALSYLCLASAGDLVDAHLMAMDRVLGFDWLAGYRFVHAHPALLAVLGLAYASLVYQSLYCGLLLGLMGNRRRLREMFWLVLCCGLLACAGTFWLPALGPSKFFAIETSTGFVPVMEHLMSGRDLSFALSGMTGVVSFPSFHTSMALAYAWVFRKSGVIAVAVMALNMIMLCAVPFFGGHYLVDMIAGAATMLLSLAVVKTAPSVWSKIRSSGAVVPTPVAAQN